MGLPGLQHANRRNCRRQLAKGSTKVNCLKGCWGLGANLARAVLDLSEDGAQLIVKEPLAVGQEVEVSLSGPFHNRPVKVEARVVWAEAAAGEDYRAGVRFDKRLPYADLQNLTAR
jgi:PilZ domain